MIRASAVALAVSALAGCAALAPEPPPPPPCGVTADGALTVAEWQGAQRIDLGGDVVLWMIQAPQHLCFAAETRAAGARYVDVFVTDGAGAKHNLHASLQVGERILPNARWTDEAPPTQWGQTTGWTANTAVRRPDADAAAPVSDQLAPFDGYEFVVDRARMRRPWRIRVEVRDFAGEARDIVWPTQSRRHDVTTWALLP